MPCVCVVQEFMRVYEVLREELLVDDLIAGQPKFSADHMRKVNPFILQWSQVFIMVVSIEVHMTVRVPCRCWTTPFLEGSSIVVLQLETSCST